MTSETVVTNALLGIVRAATRVDATWALVGGQALIAYGVPRETLDADALVAPAALESVAATLVDTFGWTPLVFDPESEDYAQAGEHLSASQIRDAVAWAERRDPAAAEGMKAILSAARARRAPKRTQPYTRKP